jgi:hypothetical protein
MIAMSAVAGLLARAEACRRRIAAIEEQLSAERELRESIIVEMRDRGLSWAECSKAIGLSPARCSTIVAEAPEAVQIIG